MALNKQIRRMLLTRSQSDCYGHCKESQPPNQMTTFRQNLIKGGVGLKEGGWVWQNWKPRDFLPLIKQTCDRAACETWGPWEYEEEDEHVVEGRKATISQQFRSPFLDWSPHGRGKFGEDEEEEVRFTRFWCSSGPQWMAASILVFLLRPPTKYS